MIKKLLLVVSLLLSGAVLAGPQLEVVATSSSLGMLAREIGGERVAVTVLAPPDRDLHDLQARPSMMRALRGADLLVAVGADLEIGWLPAALQGAANPDIQPGQPGYFEAAAQIELMDAGVPADRARGDVHPAGNPHFNLDPLRMARVAEALAARLGELDPAGRDAYRRRAEAFAAAVRSRLPEWKARAAGAPGAVLYHPDGDYLLQLLEVPILGYLEPVPGIPPTARHLKQLVEQLQGRPGVILRQAYQPARGPERLAEALGWPVAVVALEPPLEAGAQGYFALIDQWVDALASAGAP